MKKLFPKVFFVFVVFAAVVCISCNNGNDESSENENDSRIQGIKEENEYLLTTPKATIKVRSNVLHEICVYSDSERRNLVARIPAYESAVFETKKIDEVTFYYSFLITLGEDFSAAIPYYDNTCVFVLAVSENETAVQTISFPQSFELSSCFVVLKNAGTKAIQLMNGNSIISPCEDDSTASAIINPGKSAYYEITERNFANLGAYFVRDMVGNFEQSLENIIDASDENKIYTIVFDGNAIRSSKIEQEDLVGREFSVDNSEVYDVIKSCEKSLHANTIRLKGNITDSTLQKAAQALYENSSVNFVLDISEAHGITNLKSYCFSRSSYSECTNLLGVVLNDEITAIKSYAFGKCTGLKSVEITNSVKTIGNSAFYNCKSLKNIIIPSGVTAIENDTFSGCTSLAGVLIPSSVTTIGSNAFYNCESLKSITIPVGATTIANNAFYNCKSLSSVTVLAATPPVLGSSVFYGSSDNLKIYVPKKSVNKYRELYTLDI